MSDEGAAPTQQPGLEPMAEPAAEPAADGNDDDSMGEISSSDDEADAAATKPAAEAVAAAPIATVKHKAKDTTNSVWEDTDDDDDTAGGAATMDGPDQAFQPAAMTTEEMKMGVPEYPMGHAVSLVKMPNFLDIDHQPYDPDTYVDTAEQDDKGNRDELGRKRIKLKVENTIRWRYVKDEDANPVKKENGEMVKQSNTNIITWSDGSQSLVVGDQVVQFSRQNMKNKHSGLYLIAPSEENDPPCVQAVAGFDERVALMPYSTKSKLHQQLTRSVAVTGERGRGRIKEITVDENPETLAEQKRKKAAERTRQETLERNKMERRQEKLREPSSLDRKFLEEDYRGGAYSDDGSSEDIEMSEEPTRGARRKRTTAFSDDEDSEEEPNPTAAGDDEDAEKSKKRKLVVEDDDSDE